MCQIVATSLAVGLYEGILLAINDSQQLRMIIWTISLIGLLGVMLCLNMLEAPPALESELHFGMAPKRGTTLLPFPVGKMALATNSQERSPASIPKTTTQGRAGASSFANDTMAHDFTLQQATDIELNCQTGKTHDGVLLASSIKQIRISGSSCVRGERIRSSEVINSANGFSATVFFPTPSTFTTDYISLHEGQNLIRITQIYSDGQRVSRVYVIGRI